MDSRLCLWINKLERFCPLVCFHRKQNVESEWVLAGKRNFSFSSSVSIFSMRWKRMAKYGQIARLSTIPDSWGCIWLQSVRILSIISSRYSFVQRVTLHVTRSRITISWNLSDSARAVDSKLSTVGSTRGRMSIKQWRLLRYSHAMESSGAPSNTLTRLQRFHSLIMHVDVAEREKFVPLGQLSLVRRTVHFSTGASAALLIVVLMKKFSFTLSSLGLSNLWFKTWTKRIVLEVVVFQSPWLFPKQLS